MHTPKAIAAHKPHHVLFLASTALAQGRLARELSAAGLVAESMPQGLRLDLGDVDWKTLLENLAAQLSDVDLRDIRVAILPRGGDDRANRKAVALARPLSMIIDHYTDAWLYKLVENNQLTIHFQPMIQYPPGRVFGYECLLRGTGDDHKTILPARLFEAAGRLDVTYLLDRQAARVAINAAADLCFSNIQYFINLRAQAIENPAVAATSTFAAAELGGLRPDQLTFEIVDSESVRDRRHLAAVLAAFREAGFGVCLDDVGAGNASLLALGDLKPDYIKLDASLCQNAAESASQSMLLKTLCERARQHGIIAIAKGLETEDQLRYCIDAGIRVTQGQIHAGASPTPLEADTEDQVLRQVRRTAILAF